MADLETLKIRKKELADTLKNLQELIERRNALLVCVEKLALKRVIKLEYTFLNANKKGNRIHFMELYKKAIEMESKINRRGIFYLHKRRRDLEAVLSEIDGELLLLGEV